MLWGMAKKQIGVRLETKLVEALDKLALEDVRDRSSMIEAILTRYVREKAPEYLKYSDINK